MLKSYLTIALRHLLRQRGHAAINVAGLTLGLASCLVIFQYVAFETSFDRFHEHEPELYRVITKLDRPDDPEFDESEGGAYTPYGLGPALDEAVPEILHVARLHPEYATAVVSSPARPERVFEEEKAFYVDPAFLEMFTFPLVAGSRALVPGTLLLSESAARRYFGDESPVASAVGEALDWTGSIEGSYQVAGVFKDVPGNSHLRFDFLLPVEDLLREGQYADAPEGAWVWNNFYTYARLRPRADPAEAARKGTGVYEAHFPEAFRAEGLVARARLQPLRDIHLNADVHTPDMFVTGSHRTVYFFTAIGLVILLIALVNYVNLATARVMDRAREVGVRKAVGAERRQLVGQFLFESALTVALAAALAVVLAVALTPLVNRLAETQLTWESWMNPGFWAAFVGTLGAATLLAGLYPAFVLSAFRPVAALKGRAGSAGGQLWLRRGLVVVQFAAAIVLVAGSAVVYDQLGYMRGMDLGLDLEQVLTVQAPRVLPEGTEAGSAVATLAEELRRLPAVEAVATSSTLPGQGFNWNGASVRKAEDDAASAIRGVVTWVDTSFAALYGLELVAGDGYDAFVPPPDSGDAPIALIPNETAVRALGFASPDDALGQPLTLGSYDARIVGVFEDYNWSSAHTERQNIFLGRTPGGRHISLRVAAADLPGTIAAVERTFTRLFPGNVFRYRFADEAFAAQYREDERFAQLFTLFTGLAVAIACLGLFGLAAFTAQQRTKEVGVRKVLGASAGSIVALLTRDFLRLVAVAVVIGSPVAYVLMRRWLDGFAYRVDLGPGLFAVVGVLALALALLTVSAQALRAASADPVKSLRYE